MIERLALCLLFCLGISFYGNSQQKKEHHTSHKKVTASKPSPVKDSLPGKKKDTLHVRIGQAIRILSGATGWVKNDYDKWISSPNRIPYEDPDLNNEYYDRFEVGKDNFKEMDLVEISIKGKKYYSLVVKQIKALQQEKNGEKEWKCFPSVEYYIIPEEETRNLASVINPKSDTTHAEMKFLYYGNFFYINPAQIPYKMKQRIEWNIAVDHPRDSTVESYFQFALRPHNSRTGKTLRMNYGLVYAGVGARPASPDFTLFDEQFYELPPAKWQAFASIGNTKAIPNSKGKATAIPVPKH